MLKHFRVAIDFFLDTGNEGQITLQIEYTSVESEII